MIPFADLDSKRRNPEQWQAIIAEYESSGLSREEFCRERWSAKFGPYRKV